MKKRILTLLVCALIMIPSAIQALSANTAEDFSPGSAVGTMDLSLTAGRLKNLLEPLIRKELKKGPAAKTAKDAKAELLANKFLAGDRFFVSFMPPQSVVFTMPVSDNDWAIFTAETEKETYGGIDVYKEEESNTSCARIGGFAVVATTPADIHTAINLANGSTTDSLTNNAAYKQFTSSYLSPRLMSVTINIKELASFAKPFIQQMLQKDVDKLDTEEDKIKAGKAVKKVMDMISAFEYAGGSLAETNDGYKFNFKLTGDAEKLKKEGLSLNPTGSFTPLLYKKFPNAKPVLYSESYNTKGEWTYSTNFWKKLFKDFDMENDEANFFKRFDEFKEQTGFDVNAIYDIFDQEMAVGLQYDPASPIPYLTVMANVSNTKEAAGKLTDSFIKALTDALAKEDTPEEAHDAIKIKKEGAFTKITIDVAKIKDFDGPPFPKIVFTAGVSEDNLLIFSNYPDIEDAAVRGGMDLDMPAGEYRDVTYLNARNAWGWVDNFTDWVEKVSNGENGMGLKFYQDYYSLLEKIYGWKDLFIVSQASESEAVVTGTANIDQAKHKTYIQMLEAVKESDRDGDGLNDYEERYVYHTPVDEGDSNKNGVSDIEELRKGLNPKGEGRLFKDVSEDAYYTDETAFLHQRGAITGYSDGSFKPGNLVNRAEFTTMVVKAFERGTSDFLGVNVELGGTKETPFDDVSQNEWYYKPIAKAYAAGFVSGSYDQTSGKTYFRPGDNITRAEALAILNKASSALTKTRPMADCASQASPFKDVSADDWFCGAVANGYTNGVTKGKAPEQFKPYDKLTRAEAAVMIQRTLEKDVEVASRGTESIGEMSAPLGQRIMPIMNF